MTLHRHPDKIHVDHGMTFGQRAADKVASNMGSWRFIIWQTVVVGTWIIVNILVFVLRWDPYPFILLNLLFSTQAAYAAPIIMMSQNRSGELDRKHAENAYQQITELDLLQREQMELLSKIDRVIDQLPKV